MTMLPGFEPAAPRRETHVVATPGGKRTLCGRKSKESVTTWQRWIGVGRRAEWQVVCPRVPRADGDAMRPAEFYRDQRNEYDGTDSATWGPEWEGYDPLWDERDLGDEESLHTDEGPE